jgi:acetolactate synthase-1/2/3 large subunit
MSKDGLHGGVLVAQQLAAEGVDTLFSLSGGHIAAIYDGIVRLGGIRLVDFRHEQAAAHAADAYARLLRRPAVAAVTAGPGLTGALTAIANAYYARSPLVVLTGSNPLALEGMGALQDAPQVELLRPICHRVDRATDAWRLREVLTYAFNAAIAKQGPACVDLPLDVQLTPLDAEIVVIPEGRRFTHLPHPDPAAVAAVASSLASARRPLVFAGTGAYSSRAEEELRELVETAQVPVFLNGMARGMLPAAH